MDTVLLTGASGFLGKILKERLMLFGHHVYGIGRYGQEIAADITRPFTLSVDFLVDTVIHAAGKAHIVPKTKAEEEEFFSTNFEGTKNLCHALQAAGAIPKRFVFVSTAAVYGVEEGMRITENHPLNGETPYAKSKILAEAWLRQWAAEKRVNLCILRLPLIAGPNPPGNLGAMIKGIRTGKYLSIGKADAKKSIVWAEDVAELIINVGDRSGTFNLTDGYHPTFGELETAIAAALKKRNPIKIPFWMAKGLAIAGDVIGRFPIRSATLRKITSSLTFDDTKARTELGWNPTPVLSRIEEIVHG